MNIHIHHHHYYPQFDELIEEIHQMSATLQSEIDVLSQTVEANTSVIESAKTLIDGFAQKLADAVAAAQSAGATTQQLESLQSLNDTIKAESDKLAASVAANTSASTTASAP